MAGSKGATSSTRRSARILAGVTFGFFSGLSVIVGAYVAGDLSLLGDFSQAPYLILGLVLGGVVLPVLPAVTFHRRRLYGAIWAVAGLAITVAAGVWNTLDPVTTNLEFVFRGFLSAGLVLWVTALWGILCTSPWSPVETSPRKLWAAASIGSTALVLLGSVLYIAQNYAYFPETILLLEGIAAVFVVALSLCARRKDAVVRENGKSDPPLARTSAASPTQTPGIVLPILLVLLIGLSPGALSVGIALPHTGDNVHIAMKPSDSPATPIHHVVMMMLENHAFDNIFGIYPSDPQTASSGIANNLSRPLNLLSLPSIPSFLSPVSNGTFDAGGPIEGYSAYHLDVDGGKMDGFLQNSGPAAVTYLTSSQVAPEWDWAEEYAIGDNYFAPMLTETNPNRLYSYCGFSPVINDYGPPPEIPYDQCIFSELGAANVSFGYYLQNPSAGIGDLSYLTGVSSGTSWIHPYPDFFAQASAGTLPSVTWMQPVDGGVGASYDQLPDTLGGTMWLLRVVDSLMQSPDWNSTAIFITYDEGGGFYDQVAPPTLDGEPLGQRIPFIVISPFAKENYVSHTLLNHGSMLAFIDYNWHLPALNGFVADSGLPLDFFDFGAAPRSPVILSSAEGFPVPPSVPFSTQGTHVASLSGLFPQPLQIPISDLNYARQGLTNQTLAGMGASLYVTTNFATSAFYESPLTLVLVLEVELGVIPFLVFRARRAVPPQGGAPPNASPPPSEPKEKA